MKKKKIIKIILIIFIIILLVFLSLFVYQKYSEYKIKQHRDVVSNSFYNYAKIDGDTFIYKYENNEFISSGKIYKDTFVELEEIKNDYFKIKDVNYYIYYEDIMKTELEENSVSNNYLFFDEKITSTIPVDLYQNDKKIITLEQSVSGLVLIKSDEFYTISLDNKLYQIKKDQIDSIKELEEKHDSLKKISVLYFDTSKNIEEKIKYLKENNYLFIDEKELKEFLNGNIRLPLNTTMIIFKEKTDEFEKLVDTYSLKVNYEEELLLKYENGDVQVKSIDDLKKYKISQSTTLSRFKDMLSGKKEVKITTSTSNSSSSSTSSQGIAVLNYHFFYSGDDSACNESICLEMNKFEEQLKYLKDNNFKTLTMQEFNDWMDGKIELPAKSVLITVDDGAMGTENILPTLLAKYDLNATLFLISGWWPMSKYTVGNLEIQSHGHDLHHSNYCSNGVCGKKGLVLSKEEIRADLQLSKQTIGNTIAFCYPFYAYNNTLVSAVKEEFSLAFVGGNKKATRRSDKYKIPRYVIYKNTGLNSFKNMVN